MHIAMAEFTAQQVQELVHRITGLEQMNQQLQTQQTTAQNTVALLSQQLNRAQQGSTQGVRRPREGMTDRKAFRHSRALRERWRILTIGISRRSSSWKARQSSCPS